MEMQCPSLPEVIVVLLGITSTLNLKRLAANEVFENRGC